MLKFKTLLFAAFVGSFTFLGGCCHHCEPKAEAGPLRRIARAVTAPARGLAKIAPRLRRCR